MKPTVFIGCSSETLKYAEALKQQLQSVAKVTIWSEGLFNLGDGTLASILRFADTFDFAAMILAGDEIVRSRGQRAYAPRDNVLFELGLFYGRLGPRRTFGISESNRTVKIPSDLKGITLATFHIPKRDQGIPKALVGVCKDIKAAIRKRYDSHELGLLPTTALAIAYVEDFLSPVIEALSREKSIKINGQTHDLRKRELRFVVLLPDSLGPVLHKNLPPFLRSKGLRQARIKTASRAFPFYVGASSNQGPHLELYDVPTILSAALRAIQLHQAKQTVGVGPDEYMLQHREIERFRAAVHALLREPQNHSLRDVVEIRELE